MGSLGSGGPGRLVHLLANVDDAWKVGKICWISKEKGNAEMVREI